MNEGPDLERVWLGVAAQVWRRRPGRVERVLAVLLRSDGLARALVSTPSLLLPWLLATVAVLTAGAAASVATGTPLVPLLAPVVAAAGIAYAYGPGVDPAYELTRSLPVGDRMVLLVRVPAVFGTDALLGLAASAASPHAAALTFGWLVPMAAVSALALAVATITRSANTGVAAGLGAWCLTVVSARAATGHAAAAVARPALLIPYAVLAVACAAVVLIGTGTPRTPGLGAPKRG
ncbi:hypothetical protein [Actinomadura violacea]|uniref:Integral membrane protein n=1 Tax=Actinomadura violacea TaxID=2819934 RepID=A0ABS3RTB6_9ACTN|nr:hypothetical protein [Actinomadura violacea]MBO2460005.1 hypothetical protein [Actinomadura violacea]